MNQRYRKLECLKQTNHVEIWKMYDEITLQPVLAKALISRSDEALSHQFRMEEQVLSALDSPWIPRLLDLKAMPSGMILYESWFEGVQLDIWLKQKPSWQLRRKVFCQISELLDLVHEAGYLYLDLKPDNILVCDGHACLIDFNACIFTGSSMAVLSNSDALPPEHSRKTLDERADQIGLGRIHQRMFGYSSAGWRMLQQAPEMRFPSLHIMRKHMSRVPAVPVIGLTLICLLPLVILFFPKEQKLNVSKEISREQLMEVLRDQDSAGLLYSLIEENKIPASWFADSNLTWLMGRKVLASQSSILADVFFSNVPDLLLEQEPLAAFELKALAGRKLQLEDVRKVLTYLQKEGAEGKECADLAGIVLGRKLELEEDSMRIFAALCTQVTTWQKEQALLVMSCWLANNGAAPEILPESLNRALEDSSEGKEMLFLYSRQRARQMKTGTYV